MASEQPGQEAGPDQPEPTPAPSAPEPTPAWTTPPPPSSPGVGPSTGQWGGAPQQPIPPQQPAPQQGWAQQPQPAPQQPGWNAAPQQPAQPQPQPGQWGAGQPVAQQGWSQQPVPPQQQPVTQQPAPPQGWSQQPVTQQPAPPQGWSQQPVAQQQPVPQQPAPPQGQWAAPPAGAAAWNAAPPPQGQPPQPGWGGPGQPQPGWQGGPPPAKTGGNGCLKACLIVGVILVVIAVIGFIGLFAVGSSFVGGLGVDSNGNLKDCSIVSSAQLKTVLGPDTEAHPLSGLANAAIGVTLDKRVLPDADNCYIVSGASSDTTQRSGGYGRIAKYSNGDAGSVFDKERSNAQSGQYFAIDVPGAGDQAFCTGWSDKYPATGALVRKGNDLVYVSLLIGSDFGSLDLNQPSSDTSVPYSTQACAQAVSIAQLAFH